MFIDLSDNEATLVADRTDGVQTKGNNFSTQDGWSLQLLKRV